jgi:nicotinate-nucleotide pyrophosphorylase (carboxylating)
MKSAKEKILPVVISALNEDIGNGDLTTALVFEKDMNVRAGIIAKEDCIIAGVDVARRVFDTLNERIEFTPLCEDGSMVKKGKKVISLKGPVKGILTGERTALNFLGRLSGISTLTGKFVKKVKGTGVKILDTRKTTPGMRILEKYAVTAGGGYNHRAGLWDGILIKDNHIKGSWLMAHGSWASVIKKLIGDAKSKRYKAIEIEVSNLKEFRAALEAGADIIMLDNMKQEDIKKAVRMNRRKALLEVSGGVNLDNVRAIAKTGVDRISIGSLTHSAPSIDLSLEIT